MQREGNRASATGAGGADPPVAAELRQRAGVNFQAGSRLNGVKTSDWRHHKGLDD